MRGPIGRELFIVLGRRVIKILEMLPRGLQEKSLCYDSNRSVIFLFVTLQYVTFFGGLAISSNVYKRFSLEAGIIRLSLYHSAISRWDHIMILVDPELHLLQQNKSILSVLAQFSTLMQ